MVTFLTLLLGCGEPASTTLTAPTSREVWVLSPSDRPDARFLGMRVGSVRLHLTPLTNAARTDQTSPLMGRVGVSEGEVTLDWTDESRRFQIVEHFAPVEATATQVEPLQRMVASVGAARIGCDPDEEVLCRESAAVALCDYTGDHVQSLLDAGVALDDLVVALTMTWNRLPQGHALGHRSPGTLLRSSTAHQEQITNILGALALDPQVDLGNRLMATGALFTVTPPKERDALAHVDLGSELLSDVLAMRIAAEESPCDQRYFEGRRAAGE